MYGTRGSFNGLFDVYNDFSLQSRTLASNVLMMMILRSYQTYE